MIIEKPAASQIPQLRKLWKEAFGDTDAFLDAFFTVAFSPERCRCAVAENKLVSAVYWFDCLHRGRKIAYLYALATAGDCRGQGIAHALMADVHAHLVRQGYEGAVLVPGEKGLFELYWTMGYRVCSQVREFVCTGAAEEVQLRSIDAAEYARQRRDLLSLLEPEGVIQEGENMEFLNTQASFYAGQNFLLAARNQGDTLEGIELLGDPQLAPGIVRTLGYVQGSFRTRGPGKDFAMYRPLGESTLTPPTYFGLAFD